tara:strand:+ start:231 stop:569 length:339 start_codon:yes stop_codon:yes gene_type:complete
MSTYKITCGVCGHSIKLEEEEYRYFVPSDPTLPIMGGALTTEDGPATELLNCEKCPSVLFPDGYAAKSPLIEKIEPRKAPARPKRKRKTKRKPKTNPLPSKKSKKDEKGLDM